MIYLSYLFDLLFLNCSLKYVALYISGDSIASFICKYSVETKE